MEKISQRVILLSPLFCTQRQFSSYQYFFFSQESKQFRNVAHLSWGWTHSICIQHTAQSYGKQSASEEEFQTSLNMRLSSEQQLTVFRSFLGLSDCLLLASLTHSFTRPVHSTIMCRHRAQCLCYYAEKSKISALTAFTFQCWE